ncbi:MAG: phosphotransferase [Nanoarchaeota archaeon]|nr:phosphotransferase [Nanoarchaeota archaeon]MBU2519736.1 phosphotransferase [Nanoarchaeota archaeon]
MKKYYQRIGYEGELKDISLVLCKDFGLGNFLSNRIVAVGYEDFNFVLETTKGKYFVKIFFNFRTDNDCERYVKIMEKALEANVSFPKLFESEQGHLHKIKVNSTPLRLCVMEYVDGKNYFELNQKPSSDEIKFLAHQAAIINSIELKPSFVYDSWAITSFLKQYEKEGEYLKPEDKKMIEPLKNEFKAMKIEQLPHCFVHGDIITTNVIKDKNNKLWIVDFAVANYYPRIQELAVMACNILFDEKDKKKSESNFKIALDEYQKTIKLTPRELEILPTYIKLAHAMHVLRANYEKVVEGNNSDENEYWLNQGRMGLRQMK